MSDTPSAPSLRTVAAVALLGGAIAGAGTFAATRLLVAPDREPEPEPREIAEVPAVAPATVSAPETTEDTLASLRAALVAAEAERSQLAGSVLALNRRAETLESRLADVAERAAEAPPIVDPEGALPSGETGEFIVAGDGAEKDETEPSPTASLIAAGLDPQSADDILARRDAFQLARLELLDQAAREGWSDSEQLDERLASLEETRPDLRDELGDDAYDRYLFEEGGNNRVGVASVIPGSAAAMAGIVPGDIVLSYAGQRLFRLRELQGATREGARGEYVQMSVVRNGELIAVDLPRGPLGVTLDGQRRAPD